MPSVPAYRLTRARISLKPTSMTEVSMRISIINNRGGVAKSTTAVNLAVALALQGYRLLLIDADPPGGATQALGLVEDAALESEGFYTTADLLAGRPFQPLRNHVVDGLDFVPANHRLGFLEPQLYQQGAAGRVRLASALNTVARDYEYIVVDSPPHLGVLMTNVAVAAPNVIVPVKLDLVCVPQTLALYEYLGGLRDTTQRSLKVTGVLGTFHDERASTPKEVLTSLRKLFPDLLFEGAIHQSRAVADAFGVGRPIILANPSHRGATEYTRFAQEVIRRVKP